MNRFKLMMMTMNRFRRLSCTTFLVAVTAFYAGIDGTYADQTPVAAKRAAEQDSAAAKRAAADAPRARALRDAAIKRRQEAKKYIRRVVEEQRGTGVAAPDAVRGGAK